MSRGHGKVERAVLEVLAKHKLVNTFTIAAAVYLIQPNEQGSRIMTDAQLVSVRRALRKLEACGAAVRVHRGYNKRAYWAAEGYSGPRAIRR